jgi:hypothetical protein
MADIIDEARTAVEWTLAHWSGDEPPVRGSCVEVLQRAIVEINRLQAIVDTLPTTGDGVPVILGETRVWALNQFGDLLVGVVWMVTAGLSPTTPSAAISVRGRWEDSHGQVVGDTMVYLCDCYVTREAAEAAGFRVSADAEQNPRQSSCRFRKITPTPRTPARRGGRRTAGPSKPSLSSRQTAHTWRSASWPLCG